MGHDTERIKICAVFSITASIFSSLELHDGAVAKLNILGIGPCRNGLRDGSARLTQSTSLSNRRESDDFKQYTEDRLHFFVQ